MNNLKGKRRLEVTLNAPVVVVFVAVNFILMILATITGGRSTALLFSTYRSSPLSFLTYFRSVGHIFGHVNWEHLFGNMTYILLLGPMLEEKYGSVSLVEVMGITAIVSAALNSLLFPGVSVCGASGVVFAFIILSSFTSFRQGEIPVTFIMVFIFFVGKEVINGIITHDNISQMGHIIGGIIGGVVGYVLNKKKIDMIEDQAIDSILL